MKYTRFEYININSVNKKRALFKFVLLIPVILASGFLITQIIIIPFLLKKNANPDKLVYQDMVSKKYYEVQLGAFSYKNNAETFAESLRNADIPAYIHEENNSLEVISYITSDRSAAEHKSFYYKNKGYETLIKELYIAPKGLILKDDEKYIILSRCINAISSFIDGCLGMYIDFERKAIDYYTLNKEANNLYSQAHNTIYKFNEMDLKGDFADLIIICYKLDKFMADAVRLEYNDNWNTNFNEKMIESVFAFSDLVESMNKMS